jgi:hypothetical protein
MSNFITNDDIWGIRQAIKTIYDRFPKNRFSNGGWHTFIDSRIEFDAFYNQQVPEAWRESLGTVERHVGDIEALLKSENFQEGLIWYVRNGQFNTGYLNQQFVDDIKAGKVVLPTYIEIEEEKQRWQSHPQYNKEKGASSPIREEFIQIKIHK